MRKENVERVVCQYKIETQFKKKSIRLSWRIEKLTWLNSSHDSAVEACWEDIRKEREVADLFHRMGLVRKLQEIEVGVRNHHILCLASNPAAHINVAVGSARSRWIHLHTHASMSS